MPLTFSSRESHAIVFKLARLFLFSASCLISVFPQTKNIDQGRQPRGGSLSARELARRALPAVVLLVCSNELGQQALASGFFVRPDIVITNYHVVQGMTHGIARTMSLGGRKVMKITAILNFDELNDLAVLRVRATKGPETKTGTLTLAKATPSVGDTIYALGNPEGLTGTVSQGIVSGLRSFSVGKRIQITAPISRGSSGGPVINSTGEVIGIVEGALIEGQNLNFAVPSSLLSKLLDAVDAGTVYGSRSSIDCLLGTQDTGEDDRWCWVKAPTQMNSLPQRSNAIGPLRPGETLNVAALRNLKGVEILVEALDKTGREIADVDEIKIAIENQLKSGGVTVLTNTENADTPGSPLLYINLNVGREECDDILYFYDIKVRLDQTVLLDRDKSFWARGSTWHDGMLAWARASNRASPEAIKRQAGKLAQESISKLVDQFIKDFWTAQNLPAPR